MLKHFVDVLAAYGPLGLFVIGVLDSMGIPLPAAMDLMLLNTSTKHPELAYLSATVAVIGSLIGNILLFRAARMGGKRFLKSEVPNEPQRFRNWFKRYGLLTVFIPAIVPFVPLPLKVFVISAGAMHTPFNRFLATILAARILRYFGEAYLGMRLGEDASGYLHQNAWGIVGVLLVMTLVLIGVIRWYDRRRVVA